MTVKHLSSSESQSRVIVHQVQLVPGENFSRYEDQIFGQYEAGKEISNTFEVKVSNMSRSADFSNILFVAWMISASEKATVRLQTVQLAPGRNLHQNDMCKLLLGVPGDTVPVKRHFGVRVSLSCVVSVSMLLAYS